MHQQHDEHHPAHAEDTASVAGRALHDGEPEVSADGGVHSAHRSHGQHAPGRTHASHAGHRPTHGGDQGQADHGGHGHADHGAHGEHFRWLFWMSLVLALPVVALSPMFAMVMGYSVPAEGVLRWVPPILGTVIYGWGGRPFLTGAVEELRSRRPGMMLLIGLAITVAFVSSWAATLGVVDHALEFWWELALLVVIMLLGHWLEMRSLARTTSALDSLATLLPDVAELVRGDDTVEVSPAELQVGDVVLVRPGSSVPADGRVVAGTAELDESMITGESRTVRRGPGDQVVAGTVTADSAIRVEVTATGDATALAGIQRLVAEAQASSSRAQRLADRAAAWLFWFALGAAVLTAVAWTLLGEPADAVTRTVTVLVIACPHALGLAIPLVVSIATERAARAGVLVKDRLALERMRTITTVVFDKTGTLTTGQPALTAVRPARARSGDALLALAAAAEGDSEHPLARAIVRAAADRGLTVPAASDFASQPGTGVAATVAGSLVQVGGPGLLRSLGLSPLDHPGDEAASGTVLHVVADGGVIGSLVLADAVRPEAASAVAELKRRGVQVVLLTGDAAPVANQVASTLGIERVFAEVRPDDKAAKVAALQDAGERVAMVGDGVNDAPALARADVGLAIGAGTDVAIGSAGVILAGDDPRSVAAVIDLSRASYRKMLQNLGWAAGYNAISVPLAAGILAPIGVSLPMSVGALLMSASTIVVALNAQWLRRLDLRPGRTG